MRAFVVLVFLLLSACGGVLPTFTPYRAEIRQGNLITQDMRDKIKLGMTPSQVKAILGAPLVTDPFHAGRWDYLYTLAQQGEVVANQRLTLYFEGDKLIRIEDATPLQPAGPAKERK